MLLLLRQLHRLRTMNVVINDLTDRIPDNCLQLKHDTGLHSKSPRQSFRWRREVLLRWAEVIRNLVLQDMVPKKEIKFEDWSNHPSILECDQVLNDRSN